VDNATILADIVDLNGREGLSDMVDKSLRLSDSFILVYSIASRYTFDELPRLRGQVLRCKDSDAVPMVLVGSMCDMERDRLVSKSEGRSICASNS